MRQPRQEECPGTGLAQPALLRYHPYLLHHTYIGSPNQRHPCLLCRRFARAYFWAALLLAAVLGVHVCVLAALMWRRASVPSVLWFPRLEIGASLAVLPALTWGAAGEAKT
jgi:hypothetical protein